VPGIELLLPSLLSGVVQGGLYGLLGLAIVLIHRTTGVSNFAQGEMATLSAFLLLFVTGQIATPLWAQWAIAVFISAIVGAAVYILVIRPRTEAETLNQTVRTLGLFLLIYAVVAYLWAMNEPYSMPSLFGTGSLSLFGMSFSYDQIGTLIASLALAAALIALSRYTQFGLSMRAIAVDREMASLLGIRVVRVTLAVWMMSAAIGAVAGMLIAPVTFLESSMMRPYILKAFTAAVLGGLNSFGGVIVGGLILGATESIAFYWISLDIREVFSFMILLLVLLFRPQGLFATSASHRI
jgi:branched-chain amino acid transport system permease protein